MGQELELKLSLHPQWAERVIASTWLESLSIEPVSTQAYTNRYYDTENLTLHNERVALRVRSVNGQYLQTLKTKGQVVQGLHQRNEWESPIDGDQLDELLLAEWQMHLPINATTNALKPMFNTDFNRTRWLIRQGDSLLEMVLDSGCVQKEDLREDFCEIELELKEGGVEDLFDFAELLADEFPLVPSDISKAERGYGLATRRPWLMKPWPQLAFEYNATEAYRLWIRSWLAEVNFHWTSFATNHDYLALFNLQRTLDQMTEFFTYSDELSKDPDVLSIWQTMDEYKDLVGAILNWLNVCIGVRVDELTEGHGLIQRSLTVLQPHLRELNEKLFNSTLLGQWNLALAKWCQRMEVPADHPQVDLWVAERVQFLFWQLELSGSHEQVSEWSSRKGTLERLIAWCKVYKTFPNSPQWLPGLLEQADFIWRRLVVFEAMEEGGDFSEKYLTEPDQNKLKSWQRRSNVILREINQSADYLQKYFGFLGD